MTVARKPWVIPAMLGLLASSGCGTVQGPPHLLRISGQKFGGEALFTGQLAVKHGCVVAMLTSGPATVLFDKSVTLSKDDQGFSDPATGVEVHFGQPVSAGAAWVREHSRGWPISDIERYFGVELPPGCPQRSVVRLHHFRTNR